LLLKVWKIKPGRAKSVEEDIMTLEEVAAYLRLKPQTIYTWAQEKKIPAAKLGKEWRFKKSIIDEWFVQHIDEKFSDVVNAWKEKQGKRGNCEDIKKK
jgi:excisionase family DNA binding protein